MFVGRENELKKLNTLTYPIQMAWRPLHFVFAMRDYLQPAEWQRRRFQGIYDIH